MNDEKFRVAWLLKILRISGGQVLGPQKDIQATSLRLREPCRTRRERNRRAGRE